MKSFAVSAVLAALLAAVASAAGTRSPVEKVVNLLKELETRLKEDESTEQMVYDKYACWCEKTTARKAQAITDARNDLRSLGTDILGLKGTVATKSSEIETAMADIKKNEEAQEEATAIRQKENEAYQAEVAEMKQAIDALERAVTVLGAATSGGSLLQAKAEVVAQHMKAVIAATPAKALAKLPAAKLNLLKSASTVQAKYAPQSMTIIGILQDMYSTFTEDLESSDSAEATKNRDFEEFIATKQESLNDLQADLKAAEEAKAEAEMMLAEATQAYDDTEAQAKADVEFFDVTKESCTEKAGEWSTRKELREEELAGIAKALEILTSDEARALFDKAIKPGVETLLQVSSHNNDDTEAPANKAFAALKKGATKSHSLRLARIAAQVKTAKVGHFDEVLTAIDDMMQVLKDEGQDDIDKRDQCKEEYQKINSTKSDLAWKIEKNEAKIDKLAKQIKDDEDEKAKTIIEIGDVQKHMEDLNTTRKEENDAFLAAKKDDQDAIALLEDAKDALQSYYKNHSIEMGKIQGGEAGLLQQPEFAVSEDQAPEAEFSGKGKRKGEAKGIVSIMSYLIEDLYDEIKNDAADEESAQLAYEKEYDVAKKLEESLETKKTNLEKAISDNEGLKTDEEKDKKDNEDDHKAEEDYRKEIQPDCDWILGAFAERAEKREAEMAGLVQAKEFLAGYQPPSEGAFVQRVNRHFDDNAFGRISFQGVRTNLRRRSA